MINAIGSSLAGLFVHRTKINTSAHNVANVNTDGFKKDRVTIHSNESGLPEANISKVDTPGYTIQGPEGEIETSNVDLAEEMVNLTIGKLGYMANLKVLQSEEEMVDSVLDIIA
jgi:flagellar basal-body rod protein FlgC